MLEPLWVDDAAELDLLKSVANGDIFLGNGFERVGGVVTSTRIRAGLIRALLFGYEIAAGQMLAGVVPVPAGVRLKGCEIEGDLDLAFGRRPDGAHMPALFLDFCYLPGIIDLTAAALDGLVVYGSVVSDVIAREMLTTGDVAIKDMCTFNSFQRIDLTGARVKGNLYLSDMAAGTYEDARLTIQKLKAEEGIGHRAIEKLIKLDECRVDGYVFIGSNRDDNDGYVVDVTILAECMGTGGDLIIRDVLFDDYFRTDVAELDLAYGLLRLERSHIKALRIEGCAQSLTRRLGLPPQDLVAFNCEGLVATDYISFNHVLGNRNLAKARTREFYDDALYEGSNIAGAAAETKWQLDRCRAHLTGLSEDSETHWKMERDCAALESQLTELLEDGADANNMIDARDFVYEIIQIPDEAVTEAPKADIRWKANVTPTPKKRDTTRRGPASIGRRAFKQRRMKAFLSHVVGFAEVKSRWPFATSRIAFVNDPATYRPQILMQLAKIDYEAGDMQGYKDVMIQKNWIDLDIDGLRNTNDFGLFRAVNRLIGQCFGFGYSPNRAFLTLVVYLIIGSFGTYTANASGMLVIDTQAVASASWSGGIRVPLSEQSTSDIPCGNSISAPFYALDTMVPFLDLHQEDKCEVKAAVDATIDARRLVAAPAAAVAKALNKRLEPSLGLFHFSLSLVWMWAHALYSIIGWIVTSLAILTFAGLLRQKAE